MGVAPFATLEMCKRVADEYGRHIMVDLLNVQADQHHHLARLTGVIWCYHVSKDEQERQGKSASTLKIADRPTGIQTAVAGGITIESIPQLKCHGIDVVIVGSAITKALLVTRK
jgi:3-hexulose-6-phosphate synthase